ncbi:helix-turn-helix domain-containing protein [candidate division KSB1 bacterium]|nr:helix-turn-helix domain-containing protein [candidate division KSB1 bacterium]
MKNPDFMTEGLIDIRELCRILKFKDSYIYHLTHEKKIPYYKVNGHLRFRLSDIEEWLRSQFVKVEHNKIVENNFKI